MNVENLSKSATLQTDVVVIGASLAGCAAAILFARQGLRVRLIERRRDPNGYKRVCTHLIRSSTIPTLKRLELYDDMVAAGARVSGMQMWTRAGWFRMNPDESFDKFGPTTNINLRREVLDPLVRRKASTTPGVEIELGSSLSQVIEDHGRVTAVEVVREDGSQARIEAKLVVGADGRLSRTAELANIRSRVLPNVRVGWGAYYRNVKLKSGEDTQFWLLEPDIAYTFPTDDGLTICATLTTRDKLPEWRGDLEGQHRAMLARLPDGPDLSNAERVGEFYGTIDAPNIARHPVKPGLALVGDAAMTVDYVWGFGCGWAFRSSEMLAERVGPVLADRSSLNLATALQRYARAHRAAFYREFKLRAAYSTGGPLPPISRFVFGAAPHDAVLRRRIFEVDSERAHPVFGPLSVLARAALVHGKRWIDPLSLTGGEVAFITAGVPV
jgi:2-polyprenyl-6-methoxyphenol hydroxylase-like FAD-dependent oxidoreductase